MKSASSKFRRTSIRNKRRRSEKFDTFLGTELTLILIRNDRRIFTIYNICMTRGVLFLKIVFNVFIHMQVCLQNCSKWLQMLEVHTSDSCNREWIRLRQHGQIAWQCNPLKAENNYYKNIYYYFIIMVVHMWPEIAKWIWSRKI